MANPWNLGFLFPFPGHGRHHKWLTNALPIDPKRGLSSLHGAPARHYQAIRIGTWHRCLLPFLISSTTSVIHNDKCTELSLCAGPCPDYRVLGVSSPLTLKTSLQGRYRYDCPCAGEKTGVPGPQFTSSGAGRGNRSPSASSSPLANGWALGRSWLCRKTAISPID